MAGRRASPADVATALAIPCLLVGLWEAGARSGYLPQSLIASPTAVIERMLAMLEDGTLLLNAEASLRRLLTGFGLGAVLALLLGVLAGASRRANLLLSPTIVFLAPVPVTAWIPLLIVISGIGEASKVMVLAVGTFFPVFFSTVAGMRSSSIELIELAAVYRKPRRQLIKTVLLPSAAPYIFHGMKSALGLCWVLLVVAEVIASQKGLGWLMWDARTFGRPSEMIVAMIAAGALGALTMWLLSCAERRILFWRRDFSTVPGIVER